MPPRSRLVWLQIAEQQYRDLPEDLRRLVDRRIAALLENPTTDADAVHNARSDQWSVPLGDDGFLFYAVVRDPATLIILRVVSFV
ncbi:hypothetical protein GCM10017691_11770 [Pseudonocardia petroleophila]|uniref:mRNA-degrading endonuclease RelE, toxin component of the RelBE toxin-antitoxin system n=1 Tax=Pseudonocardia petroleophila TaxID=37331 RepID=A0A7G7MIS2_9PSEU|nr:hypothetical protein [Pseudonocardia petroleophila]QNG52683.1 hypothetical protein H6H00_00970 [Pseudonocardia petroleophila]